MITIHTYTATWDAAMQVKPNIKSGTFVRMHQNADVREFDSFYQHLKSIGKNFDELVCAAGDFDVYKISNNF